MRQKLYLAVLLAVLLPLVGFSIFLDREISDKLTRQVVQEALLAQAKGLAQDIDRRISDVWAELEFFQRLKAIEDALEMIEPARQAELDWVTEENAQPLIRYGPDLYEDGQFQWQRAALGARAIDLTVRRELSTQLDSLVRIKPKYDLVMLVDRRGRLVATNLKDARGVPFEQELVERLFAHEFSDDPAVSAALTGEWGVDDVHVSELGTRRDSRDLSEHRNLGFAIPLYLDGSVQVDGVLLALVNWSEFELLLETPSIKETFKGLLPDPRQKASPYGWIWQADADTILAHPDRTRIGQSVTRDVGLPQMVEDVRLSASGWGLYQPYEFNGVKKHAAFHRTATEAQGGFNWVVGVGIDDTDIYARASELRSVLLWGTLVVVLVILAWMWFVSKRMTEPILGLQRFAGRVADGDWDARTEVESRDEVGLLARDLNAMAERLGEQRDQLVAAEKDAAWREMARQIAHDIKNPLTPIQLSLDLLERARRENAPGTEEILERTLGLIRNQVTHLSQIASEFSEFTGGRKARPEPVDLAILLGEVLDLHESWAEESGVELVRSFESVEAYCDPAKQRRVFVNLVTNAFQAMPRGGRLEVTVTTADGTALVRVRDTGVGISPEVREHLFEPYLTTKSEGTGLGLAISKRSVVEAGGTIALEDAADGEGTVAIVTLPLTESRTT